MTTLLLESVVEEAAMHWLRSLGYQHLPEMGIVCDGPHPERGSYSDVVLVERLRPALAHLNSDALGCRAKRRSLRHLVSLALDGNYSHGDHCEKECATDRTSSRDCRQNP